MVANFKIKEIAEEDRPREKLRKYGANNLSDKELLAIMLRTGTKNINVITLADKIIKSIGGLSNFKTVTYNELLRHKGIGSVKAIDILASIEFVRRVFTDDIKDSIICDNPDVVAKYFRYKMQELKQELFVVIDNDSKGKMISEREVFKGSVSATTAHPREIFRDAIKNSATSIICIHNHPSGDCTPSLEDLKLTKQLFETGELVGIPLIDHIIVSKKGYCSIGKIFKIIKKQNIKIYSSKDIQNLVVNYNLIKKYE